MKKGIVGITGEYFVAAELSQMGIVATLTLKNTPQIYILATNLGNGKFASIQVKTMSINNHAGWRLSRKDENKSDIKNHYYVLINLKGSGCYPEYYIIPQNKLARFIYKAHRDWLSGNPKRKDTDIRAFDPYRNKDAKKSFEKYYNNWKTLDLF
ncbi:MAG: aspartate ammonia-lyase [Candidatus Pacebacteria bacterium]|nr:aspartate ammonia-lyase [Candidatus Paceibacterota bacterium]